jgi:PTS system nitrogen regulatory IIA component
LPGVIDLAELIPAAAVASGSTVADARAALAVLAGLAAPHAGQPERAILDATMARERLGSTAIGHGVAVPHARLPGLAGPTGALLRLAGGIEFGAADGARVDLFVLLLAPADAAGDHLKALAALTRRLRDPAVRALLRAAPDADGLRAALVAGPT